ncbi:MAG: L-threonylcarbamoyladenylate synthase [Ginsengibacter sp.]
MHDLKNDIDECCKVLAECGLILYPTDTIWGIGCDATNDDAVKKIYQLKKREEKKSMIILVADEKDIFNYVETPNEKLFAYLSSAKKPTTVIYDHAKNISSNLINSDGTIAIRIVKDDFCNQLISQFKKPIVSTSANISSGELATTFSEISSEIKNGVDYIVQHRLEDISSQPSSIIKLNEEGEIEILRS